MMIGDCKTRMENAFNDLLAAVVRGRVHPPNEIVASSSCVLLSPGAQRRRR